MRQDYSKFTDLNAEILAIGPDGPRTFRWYWQEHQMPFHGLADIGNKIARLYFQENNILKFGWVPAMFIVDLSGTIRFVHYGKDMADIPHNDQVLKLIKKLPQE